MKIEISVGELLDKISILEIKLRKITHETKLVNIKKEHLLLIKELIRENLIDYLGNDNYSDLLAINLALWNTEDSIRKKEQLQEFDNEFIELARSVYILNDERARIKKQINIASNSLLVEEKEYPNYEKTELLSQTTKQTDEMVK